jgi:hypothetical protein
MDHRVTRGSEKNTGDGAGMLAALPYEFLTRVAKVDLNVELPAPGQFAAGNVFLPTDDQERELCKQAVAEFCAEAGQQLLGWRLVPTDAEAADLGPTAHAAAPVIEQLFIAAGNGLEDDVFERALYLIRKRASHKLRNGSSLTQAKMFYVCSLSTRVLIYKGMLTPAQVRLYYPDLQCVDHTSHLAMMEPWDGPESIAFTDGRFIGAVLDRNGLRPSRYYLTHDDRVIMASEVGVLPVDPANVKAKGRLEPGRMFLIDFEKGELIPDEQLKAEFANARPYRQWIDKQELLAKDLNGTGAGLDADTLLERMQAFGYTTETMQFMLLPLVSELRDPVGSMGNDSALAALSDKPRMLYDYFKQLFAQVTNPPDRFDPRRNHHVAGMLYRTRSEFAG